MKKIIVIIFLLLTDTVLLIGQEVSTAEPKNAEQEVNDVDKRISKLEEDSKKRDEYLKQIEAKKTKKEEKYSAVLETIRTGLINGSEIEIIIPSSLRLLAAKDLANSVATINNPTSDVLGTSFSDIVTEAASKHLLVPLADPERDKKARSRFGEILKTIYKGPIVQGLLGSNPISSVVNQALLQAGLFEKPRQTTVQIDNEDLKEADKRKGSVTKTINIENSDGPPYDSKMIEEFNKAIKGRVEFYKELENHELAQVEINQNLKIEGIGILQSLRYSKSSMCKILNINPSNASKEFGEKYDKKGVDAEEMLEKDEIQRVLVLSTNSADELEEVKKFNDKVKRAITDYIDGYTKILGKYKGSEDLLKQANLDSDGLEQQIKTFNGIKSTIENPIKS